MTQDFNPLMDFARKIECSIKLPSNGGWYEDDNIQFNQIGEVDIKPMLPNDEIMLLNPETLVSGETIISIIKSCCPGIRRPEELYYPDINAILLGIKKATYGDKAQQEFICPKCWNKKNDIIEKEFNRLKELDEYKPLSDDELLKIADKNVETIIAEMEKNNEIHISYQELEYSISGILDSMKFMPQNGMVELKSGLKVYVTPYKCKDKILFTTRELKHQKLLKHAVSHNEKYKDIEEISDEYMNSLNSISELYINAGKTSLELIIASIEKIQIPSGEIVTNKDHIKEFIYSCDTESVTKIRDKSIELNLCGTPQTLTCECCCCGHQWEEKFYGFNQNDFFGISS